MENYIIANCTNVGKVRSVNEDSMATFESPNGRVVTVCDGMGGQNAGDVASQLAVAVIEDILTDNTFASPEEAITRSVVAANQAILRKAAQNPSLNGMGATCVMLIIKDGKVYYGSVGDSRIYYVAGGMIKQITKDQSYVQTLVDAGQLTQEAAEHHKDKNQITNALGLDGMTPPVICQMPITPEPGSVFLLCSDGLSGMINNNAILETVSRHDLPLGERANMLVQQANNAGGLDNITVQLVEFPPVNRTMSPQASPVSPQGPYAPAGGSGKSSKGVYAGIAAALFVVAVGAGAYFWLGGDKGKDEPKPSVKTENVVQPRRVEQKKTKVTTERIVERETEKVPTHVAKPKTNVLKNKKTKTPLNASERITGTNGKPTEDAKLKEQMAKGAKDLSKYKNQDQPE